MTAPVIDEVAVRLDEIWADGDRRRQARIDARRKPPVIRLWDGNWHYVGQAANALEGEFQWKLNDTGAGRLRLPVDDWLAKWVLDYRKRETKNVYITVDKDGARWGGCMQYPELIKTESGERYVDIHFLHDYEKLKHLLVWPNPLTPAAVQFPRTFILLGPARWALKTALMLNLWRMQGSLWALPDDPLHPESWSDTFNPYQWPIQVAPGSIAGDSTPFTILNSRMKYWHDMAAPKLSEYQLSVECRRWLEGDPLPWPGAMVRNGCLIVDIVDKSSFWDPEGTSLFGNIKTGFIRSIQSLAGNNIDTQQTVIENPNHESAYSDLKEWLGTKPRAPYVLYRDGRLTGVESANYKHQPATDVQFVSGGHSAPGVNEAISSIITLIGNYVGMLIGAPTMGVIADTFLKPFYEDTILAWVAVKSSIRASENEYGVNDRALGWDHYLEYFVEGADRAYTLASLVALRKGYWDTRERVSHQISVRDGAPWFVGDEGQGHFFLGDRIGSTIQGLPDDLIVVEQVSELTYAFARDSRGWKITCGDLASQHSPLETVISHVKEGASALHDLGVQ
ncbi:hypothetical protein CKALI_11255 [Corynebacterium kalinowskii]|uniref:Gp28/Gp37-like domain-containing protein n=1 Tax=Corynebacterium kalinowskii TaxID=2675216 RepID=A0A6B8VVZ1_9CORY|nr:phage tail protein [Corynebacterium kalinowskii]QGU03095.1 hypothetical protein CKALI_11255 [Corynebacterium kalinowskii]